VRLPASVSARYLIAHTTGGFPTELEICGTYQAGKPIRLASKKEARLRNECGVNSFVWEFLQNNEDPNIRDRIYEPKMALIQAFTQYRDYVDWDKLETTPGQFAFNPNVAGGWNYDLVY
jgi:endoglucanase